MITCPFCGHQWSPRTDSPMLCCSHCTRKFPRPATAIDILGPITLEKPTTCQQCGRDRSDLRACYIDDETAIICAECLKDLLE